MRINLKMPEVKMKTKRWMTIGATSGVALIIAVVYLATAPQSSRESSEYVPFLSFQALPYEGSVTLRGGENQPGKEDFDKGMKAYAQADYRHASTSIRSAVKKSPDQGEWWMYLGICGYLQHDSELAEKALTRADGLSQDRAKINSRWFLAQTYLLKGDRAHAGQLLEWIVAQNKEHATEASQLLTHLQTNK
jgi:Flp pilus assembly protein TadD